MTPDPAAIPSRSVDYGRAAPEAIRADIEKTRAHMDETLALLGRKFRPDLFKRGRKIAAAVTAVLLGGLGLALVLTGRTRKRKRYASVHMRRAGGWFDQILVMRALAAAARKGKPAVFIVQPRRN